MLRKWNPKSVVPAILFFSGAAALTYEIIWTRLLLLVFGSTTHSVVAVLAAFMAGLAIGSYGFGRRADHSKNLLRLFASLEILTGIAALISIPAIGLIQQVYAGIYHLIPSVDVLFISKWALTFAVLLPATIMMGGTLPVLVAYFSKNQETMDSAGRLYFINTVGGVVGTLTTGFILIELLGLTVSVVSLGSLQVLLGLMLLWLYGSVSNRIENPPVQEKVSQSTLQYPGWKIQTAIIAFGISGLTAMAYEVAWTRLLTPTTGSYIYAFSLILALVLIGIATGSALTLRLFGKSKTVLLALGLTQLGMSLGATLSLFSNSRALELNQLWTVLLTILPAAICMGMTFPIVAKLPHAAIQRGQFIGTAYAWNTFGSLAGPIVAGFVLLANFGTIHTILILAFINGAAGIALFALEESGGRQPARMAAIGIAVLALLVIAGLYQSDALLSRSLARNVEKFRAQGYAFSYKEDETAAVLAFKNKSGTDSGLLVDGIGMTSLSDETKLMAHIPLLVHPDPKDMLVIAFGMGTTYRSALSYGIHVDAVELVPSVPVMLPVFFSDATDVLQNSRGRIIINDGRNYVRLTEKRYDVITVDPPPPVNAAGTTVLYSREFYEQGKKALRPGGLFAQWLFYGSRHDDFQMLVKSYIEVFPYVEVFRSPNSSGVYLVGSETPINRMGAWVTSRLATPSVNKDINEWNQWKPSVLQDLYLGDRELLVHYSRGATGVSDDHPRTEYFLIRFLLTSSPPIDTNVLLKPPDQ